MGAPCPGLASAGASVSCRVLQFKVGGDVRRPFPGPCLSLVSHAYCRAL